MKNPQNVFLGSLATESARRIRRAARAATTQSPTTPKALLALAQPRVTAPKPS